MTTLFPKGVFTRLMLELPSFKRYLQEQRENQKELIDLFSAEHAMFHCWSFGDEYDALASQIRVEVINGLISLDDDSSWQNRVIILSPLQQQVKELYQARIAPLITFGDRYLFSYWLRHVDIDRTSEQIHASLNHFGVLQLRALTSSERPKLVIGCGDRTQTEGYQEDDYRPNPHHGDDTIDPVLRRNPTIVALFGDETRGTQGSIFRDNHYQSVMNEGVGITTEQTWKELERIIKPGGFLIVCGYSVTAPLPEGTQLKLWGAIDTRNEFSCPNHRKLLTCRIEDTPWHKHMRVYGGLIIFAKSIDSKGNLPEFFTQDDLPSGMRLNQVVRAHTRIDK